MVTQPEIDRRAIQHVVEERFGPKTHVSSVLLKGQYALARGTMDGAPLQEGLKLEHSGWRITCTLGATPATDSVLISKCEFPAEIAEVLSAQAAADTAISHGDFSTAAAEEKRAYKESKGPSVNDERARVQLLQQLNEQMRTGMITRQQAILKWSEFRLTWALP